MAGNWDLNLNAYSSINVSDFPRITLEERMSVELGTGINLTCKVDSNPGVSRVNWIKDQKILAHTFTHTIKRAGVKVRLQI